MTDEEFFCSEKDTKVNLAEQISEMYKFYQVRRGMYVRKNQSDVCPTLTANMGTGGHNVPLIIDDFGIRKLTPRETLMLQGFPEDFKIPEKIKSLLFLPLVFNSPKRIIIYFFIFSIMYPLHIYQFH